MEKLFSNVLDFECFFRESPEMLCILDYKGNVIRANHAFEKFLGLTEQEMKVKPLTYLFYPDDFSITVSGLPMLKQGSYENRVLCGDGTYRWLSWSFLPIEEEELVYAVIRDISQLKELENKLAETNRQAFAVIDSISDAVFILDLDGNITFLNSMAEKLAARKKREIIGKRIWDVIPQTINAVLYKEYHRIIAEKTVCSMEAFHPTRQQWFNVRVYPTEDGMTIQYHDITGQKNTEALLHRKEQAYQQNPVMTAIVSYPDMITVDVNERLINTLGFYREEAVGKLLPDLGIGAGEESRITQINDCLHQNGMLKNLEIPFRTKTGETRTGLLSAESVAIGDKQYFIVTVNDITEQKDRQAGKTRIEKLSLGAQIAAGLAHEIRNPLTTVSGLLQVLVRKEEFTKYREYVDIMNSELSRVNAIIDECLSFGQRNNLHLKVHSLNSIIRDINPLLQAYALDMEQEVILDLGHVPSLLLDEIEIRQLVVNLVRNGLEAMGSRRKVYISTCYENDEVILSVRDEGSGMEQTVFDMAGTPFYTTKRAGTGLGLAKCYNIAFRHGAILNIETGREGTTVYVRFSAQIPAADQPINPGREEANGTQI